MWQLTWDLDDLVHYQIVMNQNVIVWLDLENSCLNPDVGKIFEIGVIVTDWQLVEIDRGNWVIGYKTEELPAMEPFVYKMHTNNGLLEEMHRLAVETNRSPQESQDMVEYQVCRFLLKHASESGRFIVAGNSISHDKAWIKKHLPLLDQLLHHRTIDVTPIGLLTERWCPDVYKKARGEFGSKPSTTAHRALDDIEKSIMWMRSYKKLVFDPVSGPMTTATPKESIPSHSAPSPVSGSTPIPIPCPHPQYDVGTRTPDVEPREPARRHVRQSGFVYGGRPILITRDVKSVFDLGSPEDETRSVVSTEDNVLATPNFPG